MFLLCQVQNMLPLVGSTVLARQEFEMKEANTELLSKRDEDTVVCQGQHILTF